MYLLHKRYATDPRHYVRAFQLLQQDVLDLFSYVEPSDKNLQTYSHRIQQLLMRACVEVEANLTAIKRRLPPQAAWLEGRASRLAAFPCIAR